MSNTEVLKPLKTWSHLAARRRKPSEYEIVSANLHYTTRPGAPAFELDPNLFANRWYKKYRDESPLKHGNWNAFRDPDELIYRTYNMMQDGAETYVMGLFDQFNQREHDQSLSSAWAGTLARLYTPARYLFHTLQMAGGYLAQVAPASTISLCAAFQSADALRWLSHCAYRTKELSITFQDKGFVRDERRYWESAPAWQGFRELMEKVLAAYDWGECFVAMNLVAKPAIEEAVLRKLGEAARHNGDILLGLLTDSQLLDAARHRRWASALVKMAAAEPGNAEVIRGWLDKWAPLADRAIDSYCAALPDLIDGGEAAKQACAEFRRSLPLTA
ncbi:toluene 4-monooxygenase protein E [Solimonas aquatica]|uniref:Toluene 4-monooxygenase protein E n=1 Tax=Solimonas aquatica TaxID=489703 RepID=A0A1H9BIU2_9GAMM|nr:aromatic/alkene monooxygenase hydroxylase subunit beta [Solimonas aquatica]SEP88543.1 toluene 4-monooxygenase protein E [Solimonas aquatica]